MDFQVYITCKCTYSQLKKQLNNVFRNQGINRLAIDDPEYYPMVLLYSQRHGIPVKNLNGIKTCWNYSIIIKKENNRVFSEIETR